MICHNCNKPGHIRPDCFAPGGGKDRTKGGGASASASGSSGKQLALQLKGGGHGVVSKVTKKTIVETVEQVEVAKRVELHNDVTVVVDVSGSMASDGKLEAAKKGVRQIFTKVLDKDDRMSVWIFGDHATRIIPLTKKGKVDIDDVLRHIVIDGCTAMYDAVDAAMDDMKGAKGRALQLVVLTDGMDNRSRRVTESELALRLQKPGNGLAHFHLIAVAVGPEATKNLTPLCGPRHCHLIKVDNAAAGIQKAFDKCVTTIKEIRQRVHTEIVSQKVVTDAHGNKKVEEVRQSFDKVQILPASGGAGLALQHRPQHLAIEGARQRGRSPGAAGSRPSSRASSHSSSSVGDSPKTARVRTCTSCARSFSTSYSGPNHSVKCKACMH
jgi:Mg-chelatase subunit ChlD